MPACTWPFTAGKVTSINVYTNARATATLTASAKLADLEVVGVAKFAGLQVNSGNVDGPGTEGHGLERLYIGMASDCQVCQALHTQLEAVAALMHCQDLVSAAP